MYIEKNLCFIKILYALSKFLIVWILKHGHLKKWNVLVLVVKDGHICFPNPNKFIFKLESVNLLEDITAPKSYKDNFEIFFYSLQKIWKM